jgi:hypothetical protein
MEWSQFMILILAFVGLFTWNRSETRSDIRHMDSKIDANRELIREIHNVIQMEMKDFHNRLCEIERARSK